jgi:hypothetical protein
MKSSSVLTSFALRLTPTREKIAQETIVKIKSKKKDQKLDGDNLQQGNDDLEENL